MPYPSGWQRLWTARLCGASRSQKQLRTRSRPPWSPNSRHIALSPTGLPRRGWRARESGRMQAMRALALADRPFHADARALSAQHDLQAILCLGDLQPSWLETLDFVQIRKLSGRANNATDPSMEHFGPED